MTKWLLVSEKEISVYDEEELKVILPHAYVRIRLYKVCGLNSSPKEFYIRDGYVEDFFGHLEFSF